MVVGRSLTETFDAFKIPRHLFLIEELLTTSSGEIRRVGLREQALRLLGG
jgi:acyl-CoA synthetase (AMP-forming)/AMP-acid ligase II